MKLGFALAIRKKLSDWSSMAKNQKERLKMPTGNQTDIEYNGQKEKTLHRKLKIAQQESTKTCGEIMYSNRISRPCSAIGTRRVFTLAKIHRQVVKGKSGRDCDYKNFAESYPVCWWWFLHFLLSDDIISILNKIFFKCKKYFQDKKKPKT